MSSPQLVGSSRSESPFLSLVVLGYRAEQDLVEIVRRATAVLDALEREWEVILVANFRTSSDRTPGVAAELAAGDARLRVLAREKQVGEGMGADLREGLAAARGEIVAWIDGDGQYPFGAVTDVVRLLDDPQIGLATTWRSHRGDGRWRRLVSFVWNGAFGLAFGATGLRDLNSKPTAVRRRDLHRMDLRAMGWFADAEIVLEARRLGLKLAELPVEFAALEGRRSFVGFAAIVEMVHSLASERRRFGSKPPTR